MEEWVLGRQCFRAGWGNSTGNKNVLRNVLPEWNFSWLGYGYMRMSCENQMFWDILCFNPLKIWFDCWKQAWDVYALYIGFGPWIPIGGILKHLRLLRCLHCKESAILKNLFKRWKCRGMKASSIFSLVCNYKASHLSESFWQAFRSVLLKKTYAELCKTVVWNSLFHSSLFNANWFWAFIETSRMVWAFQEPWSTDMTHGGYRGAEHWNPLPISWMLTEAQTFSQEAEGLRAFLIFYGGECLHFCYQRDPCRECIFIFDAVFNGGYQFLACSHFPFNFFIASRFSFLFYQTRLFKHRAEFLHTVTLLLPAVTSQPNWQLLDVSTCV